MMKKTVLIFACCMLTLSMAPRAGQCHPRGGGDALFWGITGLVVGSALVAASSPPPAVVYTAPPPPAYPPPAAYGYAVRVAPETCRYERYMMDGYGRVMLDGYGRPMKEYAVGPCGNPPY